MNEPRPASWFAARVRAFACAGRGLKLLLGEPHARIHLVATALVVGAGFFYHVSRADWCALLLACGLVWAAEGMNTALEALADRVAPERHPLVARAKDIAAGAVLAAALAAAAVGALVFAPYILR